MRRGVQTGIALIAVLWILALLTVLASVVAARSMSDRRSAQRLIEASNAQLLADSGIRLFVLHLMSSSVAEASSNIGRSTPISVFEQTVNVDASLEAGRADLNTVSPQMLRAVLEAGGLDAQQVSALSEQILQRRLGNDASAATAAGQGSFQAVSDVRAIQGGSLLSDELLDAFTVYSRLRDPEQAGAPPLVQRALRNLNAINDAKSMDGNESPQIATSATASPVVIGQMLRLRACVQSMAVPICRTAIVRLTGSTGKPLQIFAWTFS